MRLALRPAKEIARGDREAAEQAYQKALTRARHFAKDDERRGTMICVLAGFLADQGRRNEAEVLFEECIETLSQQKGWRRLSLFIALNNYSVFLINFKEFGHATQVLENAIDLIPTLRKVSPATVLMNQGMQVEELELILQLKLVDLFFHFNELSEARFHLEDADSLFLRLASRGKSRYWDLLKAKRCLWRCKNGNYEEAWIECEGIKSPRFLSSIKTKVFLARKDFDLAEQQIRIFLAIEWKARPLHHPNLLEPTLDLTEALFGQGKHEDAFASLQEARSIVADFALPPDAAWRKTLETWLRRARELGKADVAASLEAELQAMPAMANQAITILEKFRLPPQAAS
jgi:tetratricopeptide (TPR) repeat protein